MEADGASSNSACGRNHPPQDPPGYDHFMFKPTRDLQDNNEKIVDKIDELGSMVEQLRATARQVEEDKENLTKSLLEVVDLTSKTTLAAGMFVCVEHVPYMYRTCTGHVPYMYRTFTVHVQKFYYFMRLFI